MVVVVFSQDKVLQRLVSRSSSTFLGLHRVQHHVSWSRTVERGSGVPVSDVTVFRTASLGTWTLFLRARCCDTLPTCHLEKILGDFYVKVDTGRFSVRTANLDFYEPLVSDSHSLRMRQLEAVERISRIFLRDGELES